MNLSGENAIQSFRAPAQPTSTEDMTLSDEGYRLFSARVPWTPVMLQKINSDINNIPRVLSCRLGEKLAPTQGSKPSHAWEAAEGPHVVFLHKEPNKGMGLTVTESAHNLTSPLNTITRTVPMKHALLFPCRETVWPHSPTSPVAPTCPASPAAPHLLHLPIPELSTADSGGPDTRLGLSPAGTGHGSGPRPPAGAGSRPWHHSQQASESSEHAWSLIRSVHSSFQIYSCCTPGNLLLGGYCVLVEPVGPGHADLGWHSLSPSSSTVPICFPYTLFSYTCFIYAVRFAGINSLLLWICIIRPVSKQCFNMNNNNTQLFNTWTYSKYWKLYSQKFKPFNEL